MSRLGRSLAVVFLGLAARAGLAVGPVYDVNSTDDLPDAALDGVCETAAGNHVCTLRAAVMEADYGPKPADEFVTINLPAGTYVLKIAVGLPPDDAHNGDLDLVGLIKIQGAGRDKTIVDGNDLDRVFNVAADSIVSLSDMTIQNGKPAARLTTDGGGILSYGDLELVRCVVAANDTPDGLGGGIAAEGGSLSLTDTEVALNHAANGGGVNSAVTTYVERSAIRGNSAGSGAGWRQPGGTLSATNSTFSANHASTDAAAMYLSNAFAHFYNVTVAQNDCSCGSATDAIGVYSSTLNLANSIVYDTALAEEFTFCAFRAGNVVSNGYNVVRATDCSISGISSADPLLGGLAYNGGWTQSQAIGANGAAKDAGDPSGCLDSSAHSLTTDQRGVKRPLGARCDLGSFELEPKGDADGNGIVNVSDVFWLINYLFAGGAPPRGRANVNGDSSVNVQDVFYLINFLFANGAAPI